MNEVKPRQWASAMDNGDFICIETYSGYRGSGRDPQGAQHFLWPDASDEMLGAALLDALAHSRFLTLSEIPIFFDYQQGMQEYEEWIKNLMERYRYKTKRGALQEHEELRHRIVGGNDNCSSQLPRKTRAMDWRWRPERRG